MTKDIKPHERKQVVEYISWKIEEKLKYNKERIEALQKEVAAAEKARSCQHDELKLVEHWERYDQVNSVYRCVKCGFEGIYSW